MSKAEPTISFPALATQTVAVPLRATPRFPRRRWRFAENVATLSAGTAVAQAVSLAAAPIITRLYTPADLGLLSLFTSFLGVAAVGTSLKYELGIMSARDESEAAQLTWASVMFCFPMSILSAAIMLLAVRFNWFGFGELPTYAVWVLLPTLALTGIYMALRYWSIRKQRFGMVSGTFIAQHASRSAAQLGLGFVAAGAGTLVIGEAAGRAVSAAALLRREWESVASLRRLSAPGELRSALLRHRELPLYSLASSLIDTLAANLTIPLLIALYGAAAGGEYGLVMRVLSVPVALISSSVADAFHSRLALCVRDTPSAALSLFWRTAGALLLMGLGPAIILGVGGERLFRVVFGGQWGAAGLLAAISVPWFLSQFVVSPLSRLVFVLRGQVSKLIYDLILLASIFAAYGLARRHGWPMVKAVWAFTFVNTGAYVIYFFVLLRIVRNSARVVLT